MMQKESLKTRKQEINNALEELDDAAEDEELYHSVGMLLINRDKDDLEEKLNDELESLDMKIKSLERREKKMKDKVQDAQNKIAGGLDSDDLAG